MAADQEVIVGMRGVLVSMGLAKPSARALTAALVTGVIMYAMKAPKSAFTERGTARSEFFLMPLTVGTATFLFT